ncbi:MAG: hypothetical protein GKS02_01275 [Alphaproteobacteria bacterium]|nr:hypothetical protein [Alphaproteobacteria bacterium]
MNIKTILSVVTVGLGTGLLSSAASAASDTSLVLQMLGEGTKVGTLADVSKRAGVDLSNKNLGFALSEFECHEMPLIDPTSKMTLGKGVDCLAGITPDGNGGMTLTAVSVFMLPGGVIMSTGKASLPVFINGVGSGDGHRTHVTGGIPMSDNIIAATGDFANMSGKARVSGMLRAGGEKLVFDCLFVVDLKSA